MALTKVIGEGVGLIDNLHLKADDPKIFLEDTSPDDDRGASIHSAAGDLFLRTGDNLDTGSPTVNAEVVLTDGNNIIFRNNASTERMRINSDGDFLLQKTTATTGGGGTFFEVPTTPSTMPVYLHFCKTFSGARDAIDFNHDGTKVGGISFDNSSTTYSTSSDHRLKENVQDMTGAIDRVKQLLPKRFNFIADADRTVDGFLAHETQTIVPEAVTGTHNAVDDDGEAVMQGIDQSKLVPLLTGALKEAIAKIEALETRITALENS